MHKNFAVTAAVLGMLAVVLGAFAAHGLRSQIAETQVANFETGVRYQFMHALALLVLAFQRDKLDSRLYRLAGWLWVIGVFLFSGSLYLLACRDLLDIRHWTWLGPITPIGGVGFVAGWAILVWIFIRQPGR
jgi:uncharacterized membrane protein YgdD (TMEM256/DUF423 family)